MMAYRMDILRQTACMVAIFFLFILFFYLNII